MTRVLFSVAFALFSTVATVLGGGSSSALEVAGLEENGPSGAVLRVSKSPWGPITLHIRYNAARMRGVVSRESHMKALAHLRAHIKRNKMIELIFIGDVPGKVQGSESEYASDALAFHEREKVPIWVWPTKR